MKAFIYSSCTLCLLFFTSKSFAQDNESSIYLGYGVAENQFAVGGFQKGWFKIETRLFTNSDNRDEDDIELMAMGHFIRQPAYTVYSGLSFLYDIYWIEPTINLPLGLFVYPFENRNLAIQMDVAAPLFSPKTNLQGSFGLRYTLAQNKPSRARANAQVEPEEYISFNRAYYFTGGSLGIGPGLQYSWFLGNLDLHLGASLLPMTTTYAGAYYHFMKETRTKRIHPYTGLDIGYIYNYVIPGFSAYLPIGFQAVYPSGFTVSLELAGIYVEEQLWPWFGLKIGKSFIQ